MIFSIRNRYLRGLAAWGFLLGLIVAYPFVVLICAVIDTYDQIKDEWRASRSERRIMAAMLTFRKEA